jgi:hypothetical protein
LTYTSGSGKTLDAIYDEIAAAKEYVDLDLTHLSVTASDGTARTWPKYTAGHDAGRALIVNLKLPDTITNIEDAEIILNDQGAFYKFTKLKSVSVDEYNLTGKVGNCAFRGCSSLTSVSLPSATSIGYYAFSQCYSLTSVSLPRATSIGADTFYDCSSLTSVSLPWAATIEGYAFYNCTSLTSVSLPLAASIGSEAFYSCTSLTSVSLPSADYTNRDTFKACTSLTTVTLGSTPPSSFFPGIFYNCADTANKTIIIKVPNVSTYTGAGTDPWDTFTGPDTTSDNTGDRWDSYGVEKATFKVKLEAL